MAEANNKLYKSTVSFYTDMCGKLGKAVHGNHREAGLHTISSVMREFGVIQAKAIKARFGSLPLEELIQPEDLPSSFLENGSENDYNIMEETEKALIIRILKQTDNNKKKAAERLDISRKTLYNKMKKYGISLSG